MFGSTFMIMKRAMDASTLRQQVISQNIANVNTPGYVRKEVSFESELKKVIDEQKEIKIRGAVTNSRHIPIGPPSLESVRPEIWKDDSGYYRYDRNNVDIDKELVKLAENSVKYRILSSLMEKRFTMLRDVISGGRR